MKTAPCAFFREHILYTSLRERILEWTYFDFLSLEKEEANGWAGTSNAAEAKAKTKTLKNLRAKLTLKERKHGAGAGKK